MSALCFVCPQTRGEFRTAIEIDRDTFDKCRDNRVKLSCPLCSSLHEFRLGDGRIDEKNVA